MKKLKEEKKLVNILQFAKDKKVTVQIVFNEILNNNLNSTVLNSQTYVIIDKLAQAWAKSKNITFKSIQEDDIVILRIFDSLTLYNKNPVVDVIDKAMKNNIYKFIFYFQEPPQIDSAGIAAITKTALHAIKHDSKIQIVNCGTRALDLFRLTKIDKVIDFSDSVEEATQKLKK